MKKLITMILSMFLFSQALYSQPDGWSPIFNESQGTFLGQATIDGVPAVAGDWVAAFDETTGNCTGAAELIIYEGLAYISMPIYGDDPTTEEDEGMNPGENFVLKLWDSSEFPESIDAILEYPTSFDCWYNNNGAPMQNECGDYTTVYNFSVPSLDPNFAVSLDADGGTGQPYSLSVGFAPNATDGFDAGFDTYAPPAPPPPAFDAALSWMGDRYYTQIVNGSADDLLEHVWDIQLAYPSDNLITLTWDNTGWSDLGTFALTDAFDGALGINIDMTQDNSLTLDNPAFNALKLKVTPLAVAYFMPVAGFTYSTEFLTATFSDASIAGSSAIVSWSWDFNGDGTEDATGTGPHTYTYDAEGTYSASLSVVDGNGRTDSYTADVMVALAVGPTAEFSYVVNQLTVSFADGSEAGDGAITGWYWDFGDDATSTEQNPVHNYTSYAVYTVTLTVTDEHDLQDTHTEDVVVLGGFTIPPFTFYPNPSSGAFLGQVTLDGLPVTEDDVIAAFDPDGNCAGAGVFIVNEGDAYIYNFWIYGDDNTTPDFDEGMNGGEDFILKLWVSSSELTIDYSESFSGWYNNNGAPMDGYNDPYVVYNFETGAPQPPVADFSADNITGDAPHTVQFMDESTQGSVAITGWTWVFAVGNFPAPGSQNQNPTPHTYTDPGVYTVRLTVTDANGLESVMTKENYILVGTEGVNDPPLATDINVSLLEDEAIQMDELYAENSFDADGDELTFSASGAEHGTHPAGGMVYAPYANYYGFDSFIYIATDPSGLSDTATVFVIIVPVDNDPPVAVINVEGDPEGDGFVETTEDVTLSGWGSYDVDDCPEAPGDMEGCSLFQGSFEWSTVYPPGFTLQIPGPGYASFDAPEVEEDQNFVFSLQVTDGQFWSDPVSVTITVLNVPGPDCQSDEVELWGECYSIENTTALNLSNSGLTGEIPSEIWNLTNLTYLNLNSNQLTGSIPPEVGNLTNLIYLNLNSNQLTGSIPPEIGNMTNLTTLWLYDNQHTGEIPPEIGNMTNLIELVLGHNQLTGSIPPEIGNMTNLTELWLSYNDLTGSIQLEIGNLTNLTQLYLGSNQLTGSIPPVIGDLTNLTELTLYDNQLTGSIPPEISNLTNLNRLKLHTNQFTGSIPETLCNLSNLTWSLEDSSYSVSTLFGNQLCPPYPSCIEDYVGYQDISECNDAPVLSDIGDQTTPEDVVLTVPIYANDVDSDSLNITATSDSPEDVNIEIEMLESDSIVVDIDGNVYETVQIGDQVWMAENLKVTHYNDGSEIPTGYSNSEWVNLSSGAYAVYDDNESNADTYGYLYNWYAVETGNLAPEGWHVPTDEEWTVLEDFITNDGHTGIEGNALKEIGYQHWNDDGNPDHAGLDIYGFTGLPGGYRFSYLGFYHDMGYGDYFWSSTELDNFNAWSRKLNYNYSEIYRFNYDKKNGFSVRCVRDVDYLTIWYSDEPKDEAHRDGNSRDDLFANLVITPSENFNGSVNIEVMVSDGFLTDTDDFILTITAVNDAPVIEPISDQVIDEDTELVLILSASDVDGDELFFDVYDLVPAWTYIISGNQLTLAPPPDFNGDEQITVVTFDSSGAFTSTQFIVTVNPVNDAPAFNLPMLFEFDEDNSLFSDFSGYLSDIEDDSLSLTVSGNVNITVDITGFDVTFGAPDNWYGTEMVWFTVNDNQNREIGSDSVDVNVLPVNDAPIVTVYPDTTIMEDDTLTMMFSGTDIDGDSLSFSVAGPEDNPDITVSNFGEGFNVFASLNWYGDAEIRIDVWDGALADTAYFILTILPVNDAPVIEPISDQVIDEDTELVLILSASDVDGDELFFDVYDLIPAWTYIISGNQLTLAPPPDFIGDEQVTVVAYDSLGAFSSTQFNVTVNPVNDAPFFTMDSYSDIVGVTMPASIMLEADDIDSEGLEYGIYDHPDWITLDSNMVNILAPEVGTFTFGISVNDGELSTLDTIEIYVEEFRATITSVDDVPDDQGGYVYVNFEKSFYDTDGFDRDIEIYHVECFEDSNWVSIGSSAAYASESYSVRVSTILDSTSLDSAGFAYRVIASMDEGTFVSDLVSGYSVDNLSPGIPVNFTAEVEGQAITLSWDAADEDDFDHYNLYRSEDEGFAPHDSTLIATLMENSYVDEAIEINIVYAYKLSSVDIHENESEHTETVTAGILAADMGLSLPTVYALHYNHPNPFNPITTLRYDLPEQAQVTLAVYDLMGREVTRLVNTTQEAGYKSVQWNSTDFFGNPVSAGVYLYQIRTGEFVQTRKMVLLK